MHLWKKPEKTFFDYFEELSREIHSAARLLIELVGLAPEERSGHKSAIKAHEHTADEITHRVKRRLREESFIPTPDPEDVEKLIDRLDDVIDNIDDAAKAIVEIYRVKQVIHFAVGLCERILKGSALLMEVCPLLRRPARHSLRIQAICVEIHKLENDGDEIKKEALADLFTKFEGGVISASTHFAWDRIYTTLEIVTDKIEDCANVAEQIMCKYS